MTRESPSGCARWAGFGYTGLVALALPISWMSPPVETQPTPTLRLERKVPDDYHGIVIRESLVDPSLLTSVRILGQRKGGEWTLLRVGVASRSIGRTIGRIQRGLRIVGGVPFYAHFCRKDELIVAFPRRVFRMRPERATWGPAVSHGGSVGITDDELDSNPCRFKDETY